MSQQQRLKHAGRFGSTLLVHSLVNLGGGKNPKVGDIVLEGDGLDWPLD